MKITKARIHSKVYQIPEIYFEEQNLSSYSGAVIFQKYFQKIALKNQLDKCFKHQKRHYGLRSIVMILIVHFILGNRRIRDLDYYREDPIVKRLLGIRRLPDVSTVSRTLSAADEKSCQKLKELNTEMVLDRLQNEKISRATIDFDGSVISTRGRAEGTAVGFNKKKKGARGYYPLLCTVAQTGQILDWLDRSGNVHDSNGAKEFMRSCFKKSRKKNSKVLLESRTDSAFFSDEIITMMDSERVEFSASVPFERFPELKKIVETRKRWQVLDKTWSFFETSWKPKSWDKNFRFLFIRQKHKKIKKGPIQLNLFEPVDHEFAYKVVVTNKTRGAWTVLRFHNGRGSQEGIFGECKQHAAMDYIPFKRHVPNKLYLASSIMAHNLGREIQMETKPKVRKTTDRRAPLWIFDSLGTICRRLLQRAGRLTNRSGKLILTMSANQKTKEEILHYLKKVS